MREVFVAYPSANQHLSHMFREAASAASTDDRKIIPWSALDASGAPIAGSVERWIERADAFIGDISQVNDNVTYELGFAIGLGKPVRLVRSEHIDFLPVRTVALLDTLADLIPNGTDLLFEIIQSGELLTVAEFRYRASRVLTDAQSVEKLLNVMLWSGSVGVFDGSRVSYIFDCGYKRQYLAGLIAADKEAILQLHPTLVAAKH